MHGHLIGKVRARVYVCVPLVSRKGHIAISITKVPIFSFTTYLSAPTDHCSSFTACQSRLPRGGGDCLMIAVHERCITHSTAARAVKACTTHYTYIHTIYTYGTYVCRCLHMYTYTYIRSHARIYIYIDCIYVTSRCDLIVRSQNSIHSRFQRAPIRRPLSR